MVDRLDLRHAVMALLIVFGAMAMLVDLSKRSHRALFFTAFGVALVALSWRLING